MCLNLFAVAGLFLCLFVPVIQNTGVGNSRFTAESTQNTVFSSIIIYLLLYFYYY